MNTQKQDRKLSKLLSLVLRHRPEIIGLQLDANAWADVDELIARLNQAQHPIELEQLKSIVANNDKQRFTFNADYTKIRANQGHSIQVDLNLPAIQPPSILYHGTSEKAIDHILATGLEKRNRQHVHLSSDLATASKVGRRHGKLVLLQVDAKGMHETGHRFFCSKNGVWLTDAVPVVYLTRI
ncbi:MAG: RNA 2'-phosphotransferase [Bacteroidota bacterium]